MSTFTADTRSSSFEDDPYYFLQMQPYKGPDASPVPPPASHEEFLSSIVPSFLSIDVDGRVMRSDSFSKVIAPGTRVGWITASEQMCNRFRTHADICTQGPSGFSQLILFKLLDEVWGHSGYLDWLIHMRLEYTRRRNAMMEACERYLPKEIVSWMPPMAGMFHWIQVEYTKHPKYIAGSVTMDELEEEIFQTIIRHGTLLMKGSWFCAERYKTRTTMFFRATYAAAKFNQIDEAIFRLGSAIRDSFGLKKQFNGVQVNGTNGNHVSKLNGTNGVNGTHLYGVKSTNGTNGVHINGVHINAMHTNGIH